MIIEAIDVTKEINGTLVISSLNLALRSGKIYGLEGPNGAGKSMILRLLCGLIKPSSGIIRVDDAILGYAYDFIRNVGVLIESPAFLDSYTGFQNLKILSEITGKASSDDICTTLQSVGLSPNDDRKYKKYSLGMKQRLGIAAALFEKPDLILLDEPMNALDIEGIKLVTNRLLIEKERGAIIVVSSHNHSYLENLCDEIFEVQNGRCPQ